jgi:hypothetical protein
MVLNKWLGQMFLPARHVKRDECPFFRSWVVRTFTTYFVGNFMP